MDTSLLRKEMELRKYHESYIELCENYAKNLNYNNIPVIFDMNHIAILMGINYLDFIKMYNSLKKCYSNKEIDKKSGGVRIIDMPSENLKYIQRWILENILYKLPCSSYAMGFRKGKSIVTNAMPHINKECVINFDIKDFFPSIHFGRVKGLFKNMGYSSKVSHILGNICTYNGYLPQGAPTSPYITNLICIKMDKRIGTLCEKNKYTYTRYADDITVSGDKSIVKIISLIKKIISEEGFSNNSKKERILKKHNAQIVTGIVVNKKLKPQNKFIKKLRQEIYYINKFGLHSHMERIGLNKSNYIGHLYGKVYFIKMIDKDLGKFYLEKLNEIEWE